ncbi:HAD-IC family P-type ATPase [Desulfosporosinus sp. SB140]|uniref:cation-translocating P-type ATPase n=1 Tax=Desulfosporosinus paludis TaxID=3115649 RepID=UPI0038903E48
MGILFSRVKQRYVRKLPGRLRIEVYGLKNNRTLAERLFEQLDISEGIEMISPCIDTGRLLITYNEQKMSIEEVIYKITLLEMSASNDVLSQQSQISKQVYDEVAATTIEGEVQNSHCNNYSQVFPSPNLGTVNQDQLVQTQDKKLGVPLPLTLSVGGLCALGVKQLIWGKSALARSSTAFNLAALVAVTSGYSLLKRDTSQAQNKWANPEFLLGASALALALVRENLIVLAGLSILQFLRWKREELNLSNVSQAALSCEMKEYIQKTSKVSTLLAGATWAFTGSPLRGMAVLLAGNPRVAALPVQYTWDQADLNARKNGYMVPENCSLEELAQTKCIVIEDTALIIKEHLSNIECISDEDNELKVWHLAASLMKKTDHSWKDEVTRKANSIGGTIRTAFKIEQLVQGTKAKIQKAEVLMGSLKFLEQNGVNCNQYLLEVKRKQKKGFDVLCLAREKVFLGLLARKREYSSNGFLEGIDYYHKNHIGVNVLKDSLNMGSETLGNFGLETSWLGSTKETMLKRIAQFRESGNNVLLVMGENQNQDIQSQLNGIPLISTGKISDLNRTIEYSRNIKATADHSFSVAKLWNRIGTLLAIPLAITAPVANLLSDAVTLILLARGKRISSSEKLKPNPRKAQLGPYEAKRILQTSRGEPGVSWHALSSEDILNKFKVDKDQGLTAEQIKLKHNEFGLNVLAQKKQTPWLFSYLGQFKEFTTVILLGTSMLALATGSWFDGLAMGAILLANAAIGTVQERKAEKVIEALNKFQSPVCKVTREGKPIEVLGSELLPGDIVTLEAGDRVSADIRVLNSWNLEINEAALTGESLPIIKDSRILNTDCPLAERKNMLYLGTDVTRGKGIGVVVKTGMETEIGYLMSLMEGQEKVLTPLHEKVTSISKKFVKGAALAGALVFIAGLLRGRPLTQIITTSITLAASAVPEGLPVTITIALSAGIFRMAKKNALIRKLSALETLGRTTVICSDKTGTLTKNEMTVKRIATLRSTYAVEGNGYEPIGSITNINSLNSITKETILECPELKQIGRIAVLCNDSKLVQENESWSIKGDPTEGALLTFAAKYGLWQEKMTHWHRVHEIPFDSNSGTMNVVCRDTESDQDCFVFCKGSTEVILDRCQWYQSNGEIHPLTEEIKEVISHQNETFARDALRVLAFAYCPTEWLDGEPNNSQTINDQLIYVGLIGMMDPPKPEVEKSIREAYALGVKPVMITGDHPITAVAIAKELGLGDLNAKVMTGQDLDRLSDEELVRLVEEISIFARVTPEHKLRIVTAYQKCGHIVAMTGDGVNDTPAIKQSNVGIAMGRTGTDVTKGTADMILKEDHFGSIIEGVKEGRTIIGNIRKAIGCLLTGNLAEVLVTAVAVIAGLPMPLVPIQILLMNLLTDAIPAMVLAVNPGNKTKLTTRQDIVDKELYSKVITRGILLGAGSLGLFAATLASGAPLLVAQTAAFTALVIGQLAQTFSWRQEGSKESIKDSFKDRYLIGGLGVSFLALLGAIYVPMVAGFFHTAPLMPRHWLYILLIAGSVSILSKPFLSLVSSTNQSRFLDGKPRVLDANQLAMV